MTDKRSFYYNELDKKNTDATINAIKNIGLVALGGSTAYYGLNKLVRRLAENGETNSITPSKYVRNEYTSKRVAVPTELIETLDSSLPVEKEAAKHKKRHEDIDNATNNPKDSLDYRLTGRYAYGSMTPEQQKNIRNYDPNGMSMQDRLSARLSTYPAWTPIWALPAATLALYSGLGLGKKIVKTVDKAVTNKPKLDMPYYDKAKKIYNESAQYLKDVANGKVVDQDDTNTVLAEPVLTKKSSAIPDDAVSSDGTFSSFSLLNPWLYAGILGAGFTANQIKNFVAGYKAVDKDIAKRTSMIRSWQAAKNDRPYNYTDNLETELEPEPSGASSRLKSIIDSENKLLNQLKADKGTRLDEFKLEDFSSDS